MRVAIVGAGIAGLACAGRLENHGIHCTLFDKGRRPGGRLSSLHLDEMCWDFGAQSISASTHRFATQLTLWLEAGLIAPWTSGPPDSFVAVPAMSSLVEVLCARFKVHFGVRVQQLYVNDNKWWIDGNKSPHGPFDAVVTAIPAEQAAPLLGLHDLSMAREAATIRSAACWSALLAFDTPVIGVPNVISEGIVIASATRNSSKLQRRGKDCWVIQASAEWSNRHIDADSSVVALSLAGHFAAAIGQTLPQTTFAKAHLWRFARPLTGTSGPLWNNTLQLGACGDWCGPSDIEGAWISGQELADLIVKG